MTETVITENYRTQVPKSLRKAFGVETGDRLEWILEKNEIHIIIHKKVDSPVKALDGIFRSRKSAVQLQHEAEKDIAEELT